MSPAFWIAAKESRELLGSARGLTWLLTLSIILSALALLLVSNTEMSLLDNAQVVYLVMGTITALGALLAAVHGSDAIAGERERGSLIPLLLTPLASSQLIQGKMGGQIIAWAATYVLALPYLWAVGASGQNLVQAVVYFGVLGTPVVLGFGFFALGLSARLGSVRVALSTSLISLLLLTSPLILGPSLRQAAIGQAFDAVNPFSHAFNAYDSAVIDSQGFGMQLAHLTAVWMWLAVMAWFAHRSVRAMKI
jgi:ABC-type transport system involved in multi-copper enzyme maturation permease subunit